MTQALEQKDGHDVNSVYGESRIEYLEFERHFERDNVAEHGTQELVFTSEVQGLIPEKMKILTDHRNTPVSTEKV